MVQKSVERCVRDPGVRCSLVNAHNIGTPLSVQPAAETRSQATNFQNPRRHVVIADETNGVTTIAARLLQRHGDRRFRFYLGNDHIGVGLADERDRRQFLSKKVLVVRHICAADFQQIVESARNHVT